MTIGGGHVSSGAVRTSLLVRRWDADQTRWAAARLGLNPAAPDCRVLQGQFRELKLEPYLVTLDEDCNLITQGGWAALLGGIAGTSIVNKFSSTYGRIGIGTSTTASSYADVKLGGDTGSGSTTSWYQACAAAPALTTASTPPTLVFTATFGGSAANFAWNEFGVDNYNISGATIQGLSNVVLIDHGVSAQGAKTGGATWGATVTFSLGYPSGAGTVG
jgi:hypothetical protein